MLHQKGWQGGSGTVLCGGNPQKISCGAYVKPWGNVSARGRRLVDFCHCCRDHPVELSLLCTAGLCHSEVITSWLCSARQTRLSQAFPDIRRTLVSSLTTRRLQKGLNFSLSNGFNCRHRILTSRLLAATYNRIYLSNNLQKVHHFILRDPL